MVIYVTDLLPVLQCVACVGLGYVLKSTGVVTRSDGETAVKVAAWLTAPSLILQSLCSQGRLAAWMLLVPFAGFLFSALCFGVSWLVHRRRHVREQAVLAGCVLGSAASLWGYPFVEVTLGIPGLQAAIMFGLASAVAVHVFSYLSFGSAGAAFPEEYRHSDGGVYRGQWEGMDKDGFGIYRYESGARYEGEWKSNTKTGRGVYYFPKGGVYEGEWLDGFREGVGVRTFSTGRVKAGRWHRNELETPLELWQCASAVQGATEAASASRRVEVGGATVSTALQELALEPVLWATLAAVALNVGDAFLPPSIDAVTKPLAAAHRPLALLASGIVLESITPQSKQIRDVATVVGIRCVVACLVFAVVMATGLRAFPATLPILSAAFIASLSPISRKALSNAHRFRLNESLVATATCVSSFTSLALLTVASVSCIVIRASVRHSEFGLRYGQLIGCLGALLTALVVAVAVKFAPKRTVKMVYKFPNGQEVEGSLSTGNLRGRPGQSVTVPESVGNDEIGDMDASGDVSPSDPDFNVGTDTQTSASARVRPHRQSGGVCGDILKRSRRRQLYIHRPGTRGAQRKYWKAGSSSFAKAV